MQTIITIRRPNGITEQVDVSAKFPVGLDDVTFAALRKANSEAGRGEALGYENISAPMTAERRREIALHNARGALDEAIRRNDAQSAVQARKAITALEG